MVVYIMFLRFTYLQRIFRSYSVHDLYAKPQLVLKHIAVHGS